GDDDGLKKGEHVRLVIDQQDTKPSALIHVASHSMSVAFLRPTHQGRFRHLFMTRSGHDMFWSCCPGNGFVPFYHWPGLPPPSKRCAFSSWTTRTTCALSCGPRSSWPTSTSTSPARPSTARTPWRSGAKPDRTLWWSTSACRTRAAWKRQGESSLRTQP